MPEALAGGITGVVWRDFTPGGGTPGSVDPRRARAPRRHGRAPERQRRSRRSRATTEPNGTFAFDDVPPGTYRAAIASEHLRAAVRRRLLARRELITPSIMMAYIWVWAGFSMVVIAAGLAAIPREVLEAARTDGASSGRCSGA